LYEKLSIEILLDTQLKNISIDRFLKKYQYQWIAKKISVIMYYQKNIYIDGFLKKMSVLIDCQKKYQ
jgi:hypothetical protein